MTAANDASPARIHLLDQTLEELREGMAERGLPAFRANQIYKWLHGVVSSTGYGGVTTFAEMTDLPKELRARLEEAERSGTISLGRLAVQSRQESRDGTVKYLFGLADGEAIETVSMRQEYGHSLCVSSQVGCRMGCSFCASTKDGKVRDLTAGEMVAQVLEAEKDRQEPVNHIVVMGIGEPFDNYDALSRFLTILHESQGRHLSLRHITVSTCGIIPMIERFGREWPQVGLAISLHAPTDALRRQLMPVAEKYRLADLLEVCRRHGATTGRRVTYEYALMAGVNDREEDIALLAELLRGSLCHVNLIPLNEIKQGAFSGTGRERVEKIAGYLTSRGVPATVRRSLGRDIEAACGQLRAGKK